MNKINMKIITVGPLEVNCYIIWDRQKNIGVVMDPGAESERIEKEIKKLGIEIKYIINTHGHFDHVGGIKKLKSLLNVENGMHEMDAPLLNEASKSATFFGLKTEHQDPPDFNFSDDEELKVTDDLIIKVLHTPGHTQGGVCFYVATEKIVITGDTLFAGSIGRTDLPGGNLSVLINSILTKLLNLDDDVVAFPGHGPKTTIGSERKLNPYILEYT